MQMLFFFQYYRARYETEGIRGPLKGLDNNHPAVRVCSVKLEVQCSAQSAEQNYKLKSLLVKQKPV